MTLCCPSCSTHLEASAIPPDEEGDLAHCTACGHAWLEARAIDITGEVLHREPQSAPVAVIENLIAASREAQEAFRYRRRHRRKHLVGWVALAVAASVPLLVALTLPERIVNALPATIVLYNWMGKDVNLYGLEIRSVEMKQLLVEGERVVSIRGELVNVSTTSRKVPWLRFGLVSDGQDEVYTWHLNTEARTLKPGEVKTFTTRLASPPDAARSVEIRFARADEIGSNATP